MREILYWFRVTTVPAGGAPLAIRTHWLGAVLPVRKPRPIEGPEAYIGTDVQDRRVKNLIPDGVAIEPTDAVRVLRIFGRDDAADWWVDLVRTRPAMESLVFRRHEGELLPRGMVGALYPELEGFDDTPI